VKRLSFVACLLAIVLLSTSNVRAQNTSMEVGIRLADNFGVDATVPLGPAPRLHAALYLDRVGVGTYGNWAFRLDGGPQNLRFFAGGGPELFFEHQFDFAVAGDAGVEWAFEEVPVTIGFDWRPAFRLTNGTDFHSGNWGFTARFRFGAGSFVKAD
jgi:hypothetical protein